MIDYVVWSADAVPRGFVLDELENVDLNVELRMGVPCAASFPSDAVFTVDPDFPNNIRLADTFDNSDQLVIASEKLKTFIMSWSPKNLEVLPITILDHKSRPAGKYFILHPVQPIDALDPAKSGAEFDEDNDEWIDSVKRIVLDRKKIDPDLLMFKVKYFYNCVLVRRDLADAISKQKFTGIQWIECDEYES
jgi:hypothetical protein